LIQAGKKRTATPNSLFYFHEAGIDEPDPNTPFVRNRLHKLVADRSGMSRDSVDQLFIADRIIAADEALWLGLVDEVK
jgi:hypothetical protein